MQPGGCVNKWQCKTFLVNFLPWLLCKHTYEVLNTVLSLKDKHDLGLFSRTGLFMALWKQLPYLRSHSPPVRGSEKSFHAGSWQALQVRVQVAVNHALCVGQLWAQGWKPSTVPLMIVKRNPCKADWVFTPRPLNEHLDKGAFVYPCCYPVHRKLPGQLFSGLCSLGWLFSEPILPERSSARVQKGERTSFQKRMNPLLKNNLKCPMNMLTYVTLEHITSHK